MLLMLRCSRCQVGGVSIVCKSSISILGYELATFLPFPLQVLAKKMTVLYKLSKEQLSKQHHYDFGLRALKSVLVMAGSLKRGSPEMSEQLVLMRALRDMNLPKFIFDDVPLFLGLINDLFPGKKCNAVEVSVLYNNTPLHVLCGRQLQHVVVYLVHTLT